MKKLIYISFLLLESGLNLQCFATESSTLESKAIWNMYDARFGFPGPTIFGIWGRGVSLNYDKIAQGDFQEFRVSLDINLRACLEIWKKAFGITN